jgi:hypothetical protein
MTESSTSQEAYASATGNDTVILSRHAIEYVMDALDDEMDTLYALATSLCIQIGEPDRANPKDSDNITAFKLAQLLEDRTGSTSLREAIRAMLKVKN